MSLEAIVLMVVAMLVLWGGLALAVLNLSRGAAAPGEPDQGTEHAQRDL